MSIKKLCFVVSSIGLPGSKERKHADLTLNYIIRDVVEKAGYEVRRGDDGKYSGMITVDVINALLDAELVIADLSFLNPNVFYELGLRHSTKRPTVHLASHETNVPFDNADHRTIFYDIGDYNSHVEARKKLSEHVTFAQNNTVTNPVTIAHAHKNDARLSGIIASLGPLLDRMEEKISQIMDPLREPGHITRGAFEECADKYKRAVMEIVTAIRQRIDARAEVHDAEPVPQVRDLLNRLGAIERSMSSVNGVNLPAVGNLPN